jgi:TetR/AcrR family transcriptional regulator of autoinduction and epiphytic fitness
MSTVARPSFKEQMLAAREEAIIHSVNRLLAEKGFDAMTVDEVAANVGIAKASLYKHFPSKEDLAAAAMVRVMRRALQFLKDMDPALAPVDKLKSLVRWTLQVQLAGEMPSLPSQNSSLRAALMGSREYIDCLMEMSDVIGAWIEAGQADRALDPRLPPVAILYTLYARACDPVVGFLKAGGQHSDEQIVALIVSTCFDGLSAR